MFVPPPYRDDDPAVAHDLIESIRLGTLLTGGAVPDGNHIPFLLDRRRGPLGTLRGHLARNNPHWAAVQASHEVLVMFLGPQAYITPAWYASSPHAPTWNFAAVHVYGRPTMIFDHARLWNMARDLCDTMEEDGAGWNPASLGPDYVNRWIPEIVGFEIEITRIETQLRLSQTHSLENRRRVCDALSRGDGGQRQVAELMRTFSFKEETAGE